MAKGNADAEASAAIKANVKKIMCKKRLLEFRKEEVAINQQKYLQINNRTPYTSSHYKRVLFLPITMNSGSEPVRRRLPGIGPAYSLGIIKLADFSRTIRTNGLEIEQWESKCDMVRSRGVSEKGKAEAEAKTESAAVIQSAYATRSTKSKRRTA